MVEHVKCLSQRNDLWLFFRVMVLMGCLDLQGGRESLGTEYVRDQVVLLYEGSSGSDDQFSLSRL